MSFTVKRKQVLFTALAVSLAAAMFVNWYYTRPVDTQPTVEITTQPESQVNLGDAQFVNAGVSEQYFADARLNRTKAQQESKQDLEEIIKNSEIDDDNRKAAAAALERLEAQIVMQSEIESYIKAKSGGEVLVCLSNTAEVILEKGTYNDELCLQIQDIITRKAEISAEKITIIESK